MSGWDECAATGQSCNYGPYGPLGMMQCQYCGAPDPTPVFTTRQGDYSKTPYGQLDQAERDAIDAGDAFINGDLAWPSAWQETLDYSGFTYFIKKNGVGYSLWYGEHCIGQVQRIGGNG